MDFSSLVLAPGMNTFARVCTFYPRVSQPDTVTDPGFIETVTNAGGELSVDALRALVGDVREAFEEADR